MDSGAGAVLRGVRDMGARTSSFANVCCTPRCLPAPDSQVLVRKKGRVSAAAGHNWSRRVA